MLSPTPLPPTNPLTPKIQRTTKKQHGWMPFAYLLSYLLFSIVYWLSGGTDPEGDHYIYPPLNYDKPSEVGRCRWIGVDVCIDGRGRRWVRVLSFSGTPPPHIHP